jgi:tRNA (cmo5U34)-methyltransferase
MGVYGVALAGNMGDFMWSEDNSRNFIERGKIFTPARDEIQEVILNLIPAEPNEAFLAVEIGIGGGWLAEALLDRFPESRVLGLDGSSTMLQASADRLRRFGDRVELRHFALEDRAWRSSFSENVRCFVSSLVIHHLNAEGKQTLYADLYGSLHDGGGVVIADLVAPISEWERRFLATAWDAEVRRQSLALTGTLDTYQEFLDQQWNWYIYPDPFDKPSTVSEHLDWLTKAGFGGADVFWAKAGHVIYGGCK